MNNARKDMVEELETLLASSYTTYLKTQNYHWNVTGTMFTTLHELFETQYTELAAAVDEIAERIRALGARAPGSYTEYARLSKVSEANGDASARQMIESLADDQRTLITIARDIAEKAETIPDQATADLATRRLDEHEKNHWMLVSHLD